MRICFQEDPKRRDAPKRLVLFHHAGGSSLSFMRMLKLIPQSYQVLLAEMPGRGFRHEEKFVGSIQEFAREMERELGKLPKKPSTLMGHSLGALVAHEVAELVAVERIIVSACRAPGSEHGQENFLQTSSFSNQELTEYIFNNGSLPQEMAAALENSEARAYFLPVLREDLILIRDYEPSMKPHSCPILAISGDSDAMVSPDEMRKWGNFTPNFSEASFPGGHFFLWENPGIFPALFSDTI